MFVLEKIPNVGRIICNGVSKHCPQRPYRESLIEIAFKHQILGQDIVVNLDSLTELEYAVSVSEKIGRPSAVGIRINPAIDEPLTIVDFATGAGYSRFGIPEQVAWEAIKRMHQSKYLKLVGIHAHIGSQITNLYHKGVKGALQRFKFAISKYLKLTNLHHKGVKGALQRFKYAALALSRDYAIRIEKELGLHVRTLNLKVCNVFEIPEQYHKHLKGAKQWIVTDGSAITDALDIVWLDPRFVKVQLEQTWHTRQNHGSTRTTVTPHVLQYTLTGLEI